MISPQRGSFQGTGSAAEVNFGTQSQEDGYC